MSAPSSLVSKLGFNFESVYGGSMTPSDFLLQSPGKGFRVYPTQYLPRYPQTPNDRPEVRGEAEGIDHTRITTGKITVSHDLSWDVHYSGIDAMLIGAAFGNITTTGSGPYVHTIRPGPTLPSFVVGWITPYETELTFDSHFYNGIVANTLTLSHSGESPLSGSLSCIGRDWAEFFPILVPTDTVTEPGLFQLEDVVEWHHIDPAGCIAVSANGGGDVEVTAESVEFTLNNNLSSRAVLAKGRYGSRPGRGGKRDFILRVKLDKDNAWKTFHDVLGSSSSATQGRGRVSVPYVGPGNQKMTVVLQNCQVLDLSPTLENDEEMVPTAEVRGHYLASETGDDQLPCIITIENDREGPGGHSSNPATFGDAF